MFLQWGLSQAVPEQNANIPTLHMTRGVIKLHTGTMWALVKDQPAKGLSMKRVEIPAAGVDATHFNPEGVVTRGQLVTFLWRAGGCPAVSGRNPFVDVTQDRFYYDAVLWAAARGITLGIDATHFMPNRSCTRGQVATFLFRESEG